MKYYGDLCTLMYDLDKPNAPKDELDFFLSYAEDNMKILEPLCGSGRFLVPFAERGFDITGFDLSYDMLKALYNKAENKGIKVKAYNLSMEDFNPTEKYNLIIIPAGSFSLFTKDELIFSSLEKIKESLLTGGRFVFQVESINCKGEDNDFYKESKRVITKDGYLLVQKNKSYYDEKNKILYMPLMYELYNDKELLDKEEMDFQVRLYSFGEMENYLKEVGFKDIKVYTSYNKNEDIDINSEYIIYKCSL
ncbi:class I SAM-dependent methyltransferase [Tissierella sp. MSJ-40]|uniref:Class I SAM-dependent methyltransferase n=1 Tax=Tissierella simiarum TaxID=2841534 RepID=A0ABS6E7G5_9FIRM|nr:class I SAM-dependent methyltransferase [Tissierella simiarum]MBU5438694.1 class I SAM-dependent methyltransferase [Tissierella simiarum]